jgi:hypothetical protein
MKAGAWPIVRSVIVVVPSAVEMTSVGRTVVEVIVPVITVYRNGSIVRVGAITVRIRTVGTPVRIVSTVIVIVVRAVVTISGMPTTPVMPVTSFRGAD